MSESNLLSQGDAFKLCKNFTRKHLWTSIILMKVASDTSQ